MLYLVRSLQCSPFAIGSDPELQEKDRCHPSQKVCSTIETRQRAVQELHASGATCTHYSHVHSSYADIVSMEALCQSQQHVYPIPGQQYQLAVSTCKAHA